jgi:hypothetical protein
MASPQKIVEPALLAEAKRLYEETNVPVSDIAAMLGIGTRTLTSRIRALGWRMRKYRTRGVPLLPPRNASAPQIGETTSAPAPEGAYSQTFVERVQRAVERELTLVESIMTRMGSVFENPSQADHAARVLASLSRTLNELMRLREIGAGKHNNDDADHDRLPADPDELCRELARRMDALVASRAAVGIPGRSE